MASIGSPKSLPIPSVTAAYIGELIKFAFREGYRRCASHHNVVPVNGIITEKEMQDAYTKFQEEQGY